MTALHSAIVREDQANGNMLEPFTKLCVITALYTVKNHTTNQGVKHISEFATLKIYRKKKTKTIIKNSAPLFKRYVMLTRTELRDMFIEQINYMSSVEFENGNPTPLSVSEFCLSTLLIVVTGLTIFHCTSLQNSTGNHKRFDVISLNTSTPLKVTQR